MDCTSCRWVIIQIVITVYFYRPTESTDPLDITFYSATTDSSNVRGYALRNSKTTDLSIGILNRNNKDNITWADTGNMGGNTKNDLSTNMPDNKIFDTPSNIAYRVHNDFVYLGVKNLESSQSVGVFSFEATNSTVVTRSAIVVTSLSASIRMLFRTMTVGIGESVTITLSKGGGYPNLRWRHNYGNAIQMWNSDSSVTIANIRAKDDGVYECYTGNTPDNNRGVMRLIVRDCPLPKWSPPQCEMDCPVCYNGGVCDDKTGLCICPAGFKGDNCKTGCGSNDWGRDCNTVCSSTGLNKDEACRKALFCPPDPVGCACIDGYGGNDCNTACNSSQYGADCRQVCHCLSGRCDSKTGECIPTSGECSVGYTGPACQELMPDQACPSGFFGVLCNYPCHCKDSANCSRDGRCDNGCHEAWAGADCSIALPYSSKPPTLDDQTATTLKIAACSWDSVQDFGTGNITGCNLWYKTSQTSEFTRVNNNKNGVYTIDNLLPHTTVEFYTRHSRLVRGVETDGPPSEFGSAETICAKPLKEPEIELKTAKGNDIILTLKPVSNAPEQIQCDDILRYQVQYQSKDRKEHGIMNTTDGLQTEVKISGLSECVAYDVDARVVNNEEFVGDWGEPVLVQTTPSVPIIKEDSVVGETSLLMKWNAATCINQDLHVIYRYQLSEIDRRGITTETEVLINEGIVPCTQYTFVVLASHMNVNGSADVKEVMSALDYPGKPSITSLASTSSSITLEWKSSGVNPCLILEYNVVVYSDFNNFTMNVTETSLSIYEGIMPSTEYFVKVAAKTHKGYGNFSDIESVSTKKESSGIGAVIGGLTGGVSVAIFAIFLFIFVKRRRNSNKDVRTPVIQQETVHDIENEMMNAVEGHANAVEVKCLEDNYDSDDPAIGNVYANAEPIYGNTNLENQKYKPIDILNLHDYVMEQNKSLENGFEKEFEDLGNKPLYPWTAAKNSKNRTKNRYANVIPYDNSRVVLDLWKNNPESDYINASYIDGYTTPHEFIACQGPNVASVNDMWRMIWQENSTIIVVVTNVFEGTKRKCEQYWPELNDATIYANINVSNTGETNYGYYVVRNLQLQKVGTEEIHSVVQYHFTDWPDKSVPRAVPHLIDFIYAFRTAQQNSLRNSGPVIVHCSAGAGRTGTVIVIASMLDMAKQEGKVDVFNFVRSMREKRIQMVQTEEQYRFIYAVLLEELFCGQTKIPVTDLYQVIHKQRQVHGTPSIFEYQLKTLNSIYPHPIDDDRTSHARLPDNILKNRSNDVLPLNKARAFLMTPCANGNDYINASFCDGYKKSNAFIVTQAPMSEPVDTTVDFWRLVVDYQTDIIVQLNNKEETCAEYLPQQMNETLKIDKFTIEIKSSEQNDFMIQRKIMLRKDNKVQEILHFEFRQWSKAEPVPKIDSFVKFIAAVQRSHIPQHNRPIIIHCLDGTVRSGLFCSVYSIIDKIKEEKIVDVFQTLKTMRSICPTMVNSKVQYTFCYDAAQCYLDGSEAYVNF